jgi:hypothetical protein
MTHNGNLRKAQVKKETDKFSNPWYAFVSKRLITYVYPLLLKRSTGTLITDYQKSTY